MYVTLGIMSTVVVLQILRISRTRNTVWIAASFSLLLIIFSTYFLEANPLIGNDQRNVALLAKEKLSESGHIMVYDRRLPSVAFHAHHPIISINNGNEGLTRETIFEKSEKWKDSLIDINDDRLNEEAFFEGSVLLSRMEDASEPAFIRLASFFSDRQTVDGWMILSGVNRNNNHNK